MTGEEPMKDEDIKRFAKEYFDMALLPHQEAMIRALESGSIEYTMWPERLWKTRDQHQRNIAKEMIKQGKKVGVIMPGGIVDARKWLEWKCPDCGSDAIQMTNVQQGRDENDIPDQVIRTLQCLGCLHEWWDDL